MDILISSNLERLLYLCGGAELTEELMGRLKETGAYAAPLSVMEEMRRDFVAYYCDEAGTGETVRRIWEEKGYLIDTHTAVAMHCAERYVAERGSTRPMLVISTASPYKFAPAVYGFLTGKTFENELDAMTELCEYTAVPIPNPLKDIEKRKIRFSPENAIPAKDMWKTVSSLL